MTNTKQLVSEMYTVDYTDVPKAILKLKRQGFNVEDIVKERVDGRTYNVWAVSDEIFAN